MKHPLLRGLLIRLWYIPTLVVFTVFGFTALKVDFLPEVTFHVLFGFISFLRNARAQVLFDGQWLVGLLGSFGILLGAYRVIARRHGSSSAIRAWSNSLAFGLLPLLVAASMPLLKGFFGAWESVVIRPTKIDYPYEAGARMRFSMEAVRYEIFDYASRSGGGFPQCLEDLGEWVPRLHQHLQSFTKAAMPEDPLIYLGAGLGPESDRSLPLMITPPFYGNQEDERWLITIGGEEKKIREEELDGWVRRSLEARKR